MRRQLPSLENVGCESAALLTAISSTSLPKTSMGSNSITSDNVSSHAFTTTTRKQVNKNTSVEVHWRVGVAESKITRIFTVDGQKDRVQEVLSKGGKVSHSVYILFFRGHS